MKILITILTLLITLKTYSQSRDTLRSIVMYGDSTRFLQERPFNQPDTLIKVKILTGTSSLSVVNGYALVERREWGWQAYPPLGVDGWAAWHWYDRTYRVVRVKEIQDGNKVVMDMKSVWQYKFQNW